VKRRDIELPDLGHGFESFAAEGVCVGGYPAPAEDAETLGVGGGFYRGPSVSRCDSWEKGKPQAENFRKIDALLLRTSAEELVGKRGQQACSVAAGTVGIDAAAVSEAFEGGQGNIDDFMAWGAAEARDKTRTTGVVVGVAPIRVPIAAGGQAPLVHNSLLSRQGLDVQRTICIYQIGFVGEEILSRGLLKLCNF
jgi:hypothetical protein